MSSATGLQPGPGVRPLDPEMDLQPRIHAPSPVTTPEAPEREAPPAKAPKERPRVIQSPLALNGWLEFNRLKWGLQPERLRFVIGEGEAVLEAVLYLDAKGRVQHPRRNPYLPIAFLPTPTTYASKIGRQWLELSTQLVDEMRRRGVLNTLTLPPEVTDVRPWQWSGYQIGVKYSYSIDFPFDFGGVSKELRRQLRKAEKDNFRTERTTNMNEVHACLASTEERQNFSLGLSVEDLELARRLLGDDHFRAYATYAPNGNPASATIVLHREGAAAIGWVGGTHTEYLRAGVTSLMDAFSYPDLMEAGATSLDLCGANMPTIAAYKSNWGAQLMPYYSVESYSARRLAKWSRNWWRFSQSGHRGS